MNRFKQWLVVVLLSIFVLNYSFGCAQKEPIQTVATEIEIWEVQLTGDTQGKLKMKLKRVEIEKGIHSVTGEFSGMIDDRYVGLGELRCNLKGKIDKDIFVASFSGNSNTAEGPSYVYGTINGTICESRGSGSWRTNHARGFSAGEWASKKMTPSQ